MKLRFSAAGLLWVVLAAAVFAVAVVPLIYTVDAAFYREIRTGLSSERSLVAVQPSGSRENNLTIGMLKVGRGYLVFGAGIGVPR